MSHKSFYLKFLGLIFAIFLTCDAFSMQRVGIANAKANRTKINNLAKKAVMNDPLVKGLLAKRTRQAFFAPNNEKMFANLMRELNSEAYAAAPNTSKAAKTARKRMRLCNSQAELDKIPNAKGRMMAADCERATRILARNLIVAEKSTVAMGVPSKKAKMLGALQFNMTPKFGFSAYAGTPAKKQKINSAIKTVVAVLKADVMNPKLNAPMNPRTAKNIRKPRIGKK